MVRPGGADAAVDVRGVLGDSTVLPSALFLARAGYGGGEDSRHEPTSGCLPDEGSHAMAPWNELTWDKAMQHAYDAVSLSEQLYNDIDALEGRSNVDIEKHLRRAEVKAAHAQTWVAIAQALGTQGDRYEGV